MPNPSLLVAPVNAITGFPNVPAGANRTAVLEVHYSRANSGDITVPTTVTVGGVAGTFFAGDAPGSTQDRTGLTAWRFNESQIAAISGGAVVISGGTLGTLTRAVGYVVQDTKQGSILNQATARISTGSLSIPLTRAANSYTMFAGSVEFNESITITNPPWVALIGNVNFAYAADTARTANTTTQSKTYRQTGHVVNFEPVPPYLISSVNDDDEINAGAVNTAQVAGYIAGVNPVVSGTVGSLALTSVSQTGTTVSFTPPAPTNAAYWPEPGATHTLTLTDGTNPSTISAPFRPIPGHTSVVVASPDNADEYKLGYWATTPPVNGDRIMADFTVNPDTSFSGATDGLHIWYHWVSATSAMYIYEATIGGGVIIDNRGLSVAGVSVSGLSVSGLSVTGL